MSFVLAILLLAVFVYISYKNIVRGLSLLIILLPSYMWRFSFFAWPTTFLELLILALFFVWLAKDSLYKKINFKLDKKNINPIPSVWRHLIFLWITASALAVLINFSFSSIGLWRAYFLEPIMVFLVFIFNIKNKKDLFCILRALAVLLGYLFLVAIWQYFSEWNLPEAYKHPNVKRLTTFYSYPNALALLTAPVASFFGGLWLESKSKLKNIWYFLIFIFGTLLAFLAVSQGALVAIIFSLLFYLVLAKKYRKFAILGFGSLLIISFLVFPIGTYIKSFSQQLFAPELDLTATSLEIRSNQWQESLNMLNDNFIFGAGINGYQLAMEPYRQHEWIETYLYPHNIFLNFWSELGLFGLLLFVFIVIFVVKTLWGLFRIKNILAWPLTLAWLTWFVHGLVDVPYFKNDLSILFFIFLGLTLLAHKFDGATKK